MRTDPDLHDAMSRCQSLVTVALERAGFDPCPAIKIAQEATAVAWEVWNQQAEKIDELVAALEDVVLLFGGSPFYTFTAAQSKRFDELFVQSTDLPAPTLAPSRTYTTEERLEGASRWVKWSREDGQRALIERLRKIIEENKAHERTNMEG